LKEAPDTRIENRGGVLRRLVFGTGSGDRAETGEDASFGGDWSSKPNASSQVGHLSDVWAGPVPPISYKAPPNVTTVQASRSNEVHHDINLSPLVAEADSLRLRS
jgi:hypothetical protein